MPNNFTFRVGVALIVISALMLPLVGASLTGNQQDINRQPTDTPSATEPPAPPNQSRVSGVETAIQPVMSAPPERAPESPLDTTAAPTLDYIPSESISEDKSVSFPIDI